MTEKKPRKKGMLLMLAGLILVFAAAALVWYNRYEDARSGEESALVLTKLEEATSKAQAESPDYRMPMVSIDGRDYIGRIRIDSLDINLPLMAYWEEADSRIAPCRYTGSAYNNTLVLCGHNYRTMFGPIHRIEEGAAVVLTDVNGNVFTYEVSEVYTLGAEDVEEMVTGDEWDLTLFTCTLGGQSRITVRCVQKNPAQVQPDPAAE